MTPDTVATYWDRETGWIRHLATADHTHTRCGERTLAGNSCWDVADLAGPVRFCPECYPEGAIVRAIANGAHTVQEIADATKLKAARIRRIARRLTTRGVLVAEKRRRYDRQQSYMHGGDSALFGGAGVCVRHFWHYELSAVRNTSAIVQKAIRASLRRDG